MSYTSKVSKAHKDSVSVRTTIPEQIAKEIDLEVGSVISWKVEIRDGKKFVVLKKLE